MADATGILVFGDAPDGQLASTAQELLAAGRSLSDALNQELAIAVIGSDVADALRSRPSPTARTKPTR